MPTRGRGGFVAKESGRKVVASNRKARHDFHIEDVFEAGIVLTGTEVKALRAGRASLTAGFATIAGGGAGSRTCTSPSTPRGPGRITHPGASASCCCTLGRSR